MAKIIPPAPIDMPFTSSNWTDWWERIRRQLNDPTIAHNDLSGLQGGNATERYHITAAEAASIASIASINETIDDRVAALLVAGANITLTYNDAANTLTIAASGGGGSGNAVTASVDFGASFTDKATVTVSEAWVTATTNIVAHVLPSADADEMYLLDIKPVVSNRTVGSFDLTLYSEPEARGIYEVMCIGV